MRINLFDDHQRNAFYPLSLTRPIGELRFGIFTLKERWTQLLGHRVDSYGVQHLSDAFPLSIEEDNLFINARLFPSSACRPFVALQSGHRQDESALKMNSCIRLKGEIIMLRCDAEKARVWQTTEGRSEEFDLFPEIDTTGVDLQMLSHLTDLFTYNHKAIEADFRQLGHGRISTQPDPTLTILGDPGNLFIEEGAQVEACYLNTRKGPIYIGQNAVVMEGSVIHGPFALCDHATVRAGSKMYGATTIGPHSKVGGEISNSIIQGYSNKAHDGFLGNSVLGEWCNLGADTNTSNLKNNYSEIKLWNADTHSMEASGLNFCGLLMGDHAKCGINTMFNTGTTVGVSANVFGGGFPKKHLHSFFWGGSDERGVYDIEKAIETAKKVKARRGLTLSDDEEKIFRHIHENVLDGR